MSSSMLSLCLAIFAVNAAQAMDCSFIGSKKVGDQIFHECPRVPFLEQEKSYCCVTTDGGFECCDLPTFFLKVLIPIVIIGIVLSFLISCVCCFCCPFCCIYKRRSGRVF